MLSQYHEVIAVDIVDEKVQKINRHISPIQDYYIEKYLSEKPLQLKATIHGAEAYASADFIIVATPTNYDTKQNFFDTSAVEAVIDLVFELNKGKARKEHPVVVIKSTVPVGYTKRIRAQYMEIYGDVGKNILFAPEFLRESKALYDNLYPSRIIVGRNPEDKMMCAAAKTAKLCRKVQ